MKKVFIVTGEYSGDIHAAKVAEALKNSDPSIIIEGVGGKNLKAAGVKLLEDRKSVV